MALGNHGVELEAKGLTWSNEKFEMFYLEFFMSLFVHTSFELKDSRILKVTRE